MNGASLTDKPKIVQSLKAFASGTLAENTIAFFDALGYRSNKTAELESNTPAGLLETVGQPNFLNPKRAQAAAWQSVDFQFQLADEDIRKLGEGALDFDSKTTATLTEKQIESYIFFAVELKQDSYTRTQLADITREINRLFPMPALVLFKHGETLTLSIIDRRVHKRDAARDVLKKVTLIKDIRIEEPHRGQVEILFDLAFPQLVTKFEITNFVQLDEAWRKTLDTSELNKRFYKDLANWYFWALQHVEFPKQEGVADDVNRATNVIRLITRLIFVWFLKERELVPDALFDRNELTEVLKDLSDDKSTFYKAILQNLFFATLNTPMDSSEFKRDFLKENTPRGYNSGYMVSNYYRHKKLFKEPDAALAMFASIPFLNGGLFECLDKREEVAGKVIEVRVDGFSEKEKNQPRVPNELFFAESADVDLSAAYGDARRKREKVRGLVRILESYNFTITENTPIEEEVALDPELLGKVFENLLASYNPETGATARRQTGSYYTPREIVNYMVDESLIAYLETQLVVEKDEKHDGLNERLRQLFAYTDDSHQFAVKEVDNLIAAIDSVKILDPACGSGAFPMGILQKLVFILAKLDPQNAKWEQRQIERVREAMRAAERIEDHKFRENTLQDLQTQIASIEEAFARNELDYGRKLFLIENCIYGVDIQPIAIQIAKLRFFISLVIDQTIRAQADNLGIRPLPNLETKFVAANTLLGIEKPAQRMLQNEELKHAIEEKERELNSVRERHFTARTTRTKEKYRKEDERLRREIGKLLERDNWSPDTTAKLMAWNPYDQNISADFFDAQWMFSVTTAFDVIIGNPPYDVLNITEGHHVSQRALAALRADPVYQYALGGKLNLFRLFLARSFHYLKNKGFVTFIIPYGFMCDSTSKLIREHVLLTKQIHFVEAFPERDDPNKRLFPAAKMSTCIVLIENTAPNAPFPVRTHYSRIITPNVPTVELSQEVISSFDPQNMSIPLMTNEDLLIVRNMCKSGLKVRDVGRCYEGEINLTFHKKYLRAVAKGNMPMVKGAGVQRYRLLKTMSQGEVEFLDYNAYSREIRSPKSLHHKRPRLIMQGITGVNEKIRLKMTLLGANTFCGNSVNYILLSRDALKLESVLGVLNSKLLNWFFRLFSTNSNVNGYEIDSLPLPSVAKLADSNIGELARDIINMKNKYDYPENVDKQARVSTLECEIDQLVYDLYELTPEERAIVEASVQR